MATINISKFPDGDSVVLHFQTESRRINAYTLASSLVAIADAAKAANAAINPGFDIEIVVEAVGPGSFRVQIAALYKSTKDLFSTRGAATAIICSVIAGYILHVTLSDDVKVIINTDEVIIEHGNDRIIVPRDVYDAVQVAEKNPEFRAAVAKTFDAIADDSEVTGLAFVESIDSPPPDFVIPRDAIQNAAAPPVREPEERVKIEPADLYIVKAILERGRRKWEFSWRGFKITAPVTHDEFHARFRAHEITIAPGDQLSVRLAVKQQCDPATGIYTNVSYEVVEVLEHIPGLRQPPLGGNDDSEDHL